MLDRWARGRHLDRNGPPLVVNEEMMALTLAVVGEALLGTAMAPHTRAVHAAFTEFSQAFMAVAVNPLEWLTVKLPILPGARRLRASAARLRRIVSQIITDRQQTLHAFDPPRDLLGLLLSAKDADTGQTLTSDELRDEVITFLIAGHETSATALSWTWYLLSRHSQAEWRMREEIDRVLGGAAISFTSLAALPYTRAVLEESMRLYPPVYAFDRRCESPDRLGGYDIPAGALISLCPYITHRLPEFWDAPEEFRPERFLDGPPSHSFAYLPFSAGPRRCAGSTFAMLEMMVVLVTVLQRCRLRLSRDIEIAPEPHITLRPRQDIVMSTVALPLNSY